MFCLHRNHFIAGLALCALGNICTAEMARDVAPEVAALLHSKNSYVRKKAALCSVRIVKKVPDLADEFVDGAGELLSDRHHGVLLCAVTLALELCGVDESHVVHFRKHVSVLVKILMSLIRAGYSAEHDVGGHADPFLQVKLLQLLAKLGAGDADASDAMSDVLANVASNTDGAKNAGNAILYEAVNGEFLLISAYTAIRELTTSCHVYSDHRRGICRRASRAGGEHPRPFPR